MTTRTAISLLLTTGAAAAFVSACGGTSTTCGEGTTRDGNKCVAANAGGSGGEAGSTGTGGSAQGGSAGGPVDENSPPDFAGVGAVAPASDTALLVAWQPATDDRSAAGDIRYNVYVATESGMQNFGAPQAEAPAGATSVTLTNQAPGAEQFIVVRAVDGDGVEEANTVELSSTPETDDAPPEFGGVTGAAPAGAGSTTVSWQAATDDKSPAGAISYLIYWSQTEGTAINGTLGLLTSPGVTEATVTGLPLADGDFFFSVRAVDAAGNVDEAPDPVAEVGGKSGPDTTPPVFGGCRAVGSPTASGARVEWNEARDDVTAAENIRYRIYAEKGEIQPGDPLGAFQEFTGTTSADIVGLDPTTQYSIICRAVDEAGLEDENFVIRLETTLSDSIAPTFGGITAATVGATDADLSWDAASDDQSRPEDIRYAVFQSLNSTFNFETPVTTTLPGEVAIRLDGLDPNTEYFWTVRAIDEAGNQDANTQALNRTTLVSFALNVQPIFTVNCAVATCHIRGNPPQGLVLEEGFAFSNIVDVPAVGTGMALRIDASNLDPMGSLLYRKDADAMIAGDGGGPMPPPPRAELTTAEIDAIGNWIAQGSLEN